LLVRCWIFPSVERSFRRAGVSPSRPRASACFHPRPQSSPRYHFCRARRPLCSVPTASSSTWLRFFVPTPVVCFELPLQSAPRSPCPVRPCLRAPDPVLRSDFSFGFLVPGLVSALAYFCAGKDRHRSFLRFCGSSLVFTDWCVVVFLLSQGFYLVIV
jgi:hypothetical protein